MDWQLCLQPVLHPQHAAVSLQVQDVLWWSLYQGEGLLKGSWLRQKALAECMKLIHYEVSSVTVGLLVHATAG